MIQFITPNPSLEHTWVLQSFCKGSHQHVTKELVLPSGKGVNAAFGVKTLGGECICTGFLGGLPGKFHESMMQKSGIPYKWTWVNGNTRTAVAVLDRSEPEKDATLISELGPKATEEEWKQLRKSILSTKCDIAAICGGMPPGFPHIELKGIINDLKELGVQTWVDTSREGLSPCLDAVPYGLKINAMEAGLISGIFIYNPDSALESARRLLETDLQVVVITLGETGAVAVSSNGTWTVEPPKIQARSSVGSGDAFLAGLLFGITSKASLADSLRMAAAAGTANALIMGGGRFTLNNFQKLLGKTRVQMLNQSK